MSRGFADLTGEKFGMYLVLGDSGERRNSTVMWNCRCDCGKEKLVRGGNLKSGSSKSCGCNKDHYKVNARNATVDHAGKRFGRLVALHQESPEKLGRALWVCECDCGVVKTVPAYRLVAGSTTSCGCAQKEAVTRHGLSGHPLYNTWNGIIQRCYDPNHPAFKWYGANGIGVCDRWRESPLSFIKDMGAKPDGYSIDRIDGTKDYSKENCRWATSSEQQNNRRNNRWFLYLGDVYNMKQLCLKVGINPSTVMTRLSRGKSIEQAIPVDFKEIEYDQAMNLKFN